MEPIINISNSADYKLMNRSTTPSEDEDELNPAHHFQNSSLDIIYSTDNGVVINPNDSQNIDDLSQSTTINLYPYETYLNLSSSSSQSSLNQPLLNEKQQILPIYTNDIKIKSPISPDKILPKKSYSFMKFYLIDMFLSAFIITPLVNIHWRGAWDLLDIYLLSKNEHLSALISLIVSLIILYFIYLTQNQLQIFYEKYRKHFLGQFMTRFYTLIMAFAYINQWRGLWNLLDLTSNRWYDLLIETFISVIFLLLMKSIYNLNSAPFLIGTDVESYFLLGSKTNLTTKRYWQYTYDFLFYEIIEAPLVVIAWRGLYNLSDLYIYPDNKSLSMLISFAIGYSLYFLLVLLQIPMMSCLINDHDKLIHRFLTNLFHLIAFISVVQIWRCLWMLCEQYINIPGYHHLTLCLCYVVAYILLTCGLTSCSLNGPGGVKDNYIDDQPILLFKFDYISTLFKKNKSGHIHLEKNNNFGSDSSSTETIVPSNEISYRGEPP